MGLFYPHIWLYGMSDQYVVCRPPGCLRGWKLEAVKQAGDNPPAESGAGYNLAHTAAAAVPIGKEAVPDGAASSFSVPAGRLQ